jgi:hypothetical protein
MLSAEEVESNVLVTLLQGDESRNSTIQICINQPTIMTVTNNLLILPSTPFPNDVGYLHNRSRCYVAAMWIISNSVH